MAGYASRDRGDSETVVGGGAAAASAAQQGGPNRAAAGYFQFHTRGRGGLSTTTPEPDDEEKIHVAISALQATFNVIDGTAAPLSGKVQHADCEACNSPPGLFEIDLEANHPEPPLAEYVGCLPMSSFDFIVKHTKCVAIIGSIVVNCCKAVMAHCTPADQGEELQERCYKYSQKALGFETCTFIASCFAAPVVSSTGSVTTLNVAAAGLLVAISIELFSLMMEKKKKNTKSLGRGLVYLSSSLLILSTFLMFISFDKRYGYGILSVPLLIVGAALFQHKMLPAGVHGNEEAIQEELDNIFDTWAIILNVGGFVTLLFTYNMQAEYSSASATGFLFMFTIVLSLFEMMVATARPVALARLATYLHYLVMFLFVGTLMSILITVTKSFGLMNG